MSAENPAVPLSSIADGDDMFDALTGGSGTATGVRVNRNRVLGYSAVWRAVNLISGGVGRLPLGVFRYLTPRGKEPDYKHQCRRVLRRPNEYMTPIIFRKTIQSHALLDGNGYAYIARDLSMRPTDLLPLDPRRTWPVRVDGMLWYVTETGAMVPGKRRRREMAKIAATDVLHIPGLGYDGLCGYPVVRLLRETFGTAIAARDYGSRFFANDGRPGVAIEVPASMKLDAITNIRESWGAMHTGIQNAHKVAILREGMKLVPLGAANARDAQLLENRSFDAREIANVFGVPAHKLGDPSRTAYNSLEAENQSFLDDTLDDWLCTWEQEMERKLLTEFEKDAESHCIEFNRRALLRTNLTARGAYYSQAIQIGWKSRDEVREEEGDNPIPGGKGSEFVLPVNVATVNPAPAADPAPTPAPEPTP